MKAFHVLAVLALIGDVASAAAISLPRPRPAEAPAPSEPEAKTETKTEAPAGPSACQMRLVDIAVAENLPPLIGPGGCGAPDAVRLQAVLLPDQTRVPLMPPATLRCAMAEEVSHFVRDDLVSAIAALGTTLIAIDNFDSYDCRGRNRIVGAKLSEHGRANALDVRGFRLANHEFAGLTDAAFSHPFRDGLKKAVCTRFTTVLGPGSDGYHEDHIHLDLAERRNNYRICQWDVRDPAPLVPLPRPRPNIPDQEPGREAVPG